MKQKSKNCFQILLFLSFTLFFLSCEKEETILKNNDSEISIKKITLDDISGRAKLMEKISKYIKPLNTIVAGAQQRLIHYEDYGFSIDTDEIVMIVKDDYESFTFPIYRNGKLSPSENLLVTKLEDGNFKALLINYDLSIQEKIDFNNENLQFLDGKINVKDPNETAIDSIDIAERRGRICITFTYLACKEGGDRHVAGPRCRNFDGNINVTTCYYGDIQDNTNSSWLAPENQGGGGGTSGGGGSTAPVPPIPPVIITVPIILNPVLNPCELLKSIGDVDKIDMKSNIDWLKEKVNATVNNKEHGVEVKKVMNPDETFTYQKNQVSSIDEYSVPIETGIQYIGSAHSHPKKSFGMFSFGDVLLLRDTYEAAGNTRREDVFIMVVCKNAVTGIAEVYALRIKSITDLQTMLEIEFDKYNGLSYDDKMNKIHTEQQMKYDQSENQLEKSFLQQFALYGISLFKATDDSLKNWNKIELSATTPVTVISTPCN